MPALDSPLGSARLVPRPVRIAGSIVNPVLGQKSIAKVTNVREMSNEIWEMAGRGKALRGMHAIGNAWIFPSEGAGPRKFCQNGESVNHTLQGAKARLYHVALYLLMVAAAVENEMQHPQGTAGRDTRRARATTDRHTCAHTRHTHTPGRWLCPVALSSRSSCSRCAPVFSIDDRCASSARQQR